MPLVFIKDNLLPFALNCFKGLNFLSTLETVHTASYLPIHFLIAFIISFFLKVKLVATLQYNQIFLKYFLILLKNDEELENQRFYPDNFLGLTKKYQRHFLLI